MGKKGEGTFTLQSSRNQSFSELQERDTNFKCYKLHHLVSNCPVLTWAQALRTSSIVTFLISSVCISMLLLRFYCNAYDFCCRIGWVAVWRVKTVMLLSKWTFGPQPICLILCLDFLKFTISYWVITLDKVSDKSEGVVTVSKGPPATFWFPLPLV